MKTACKKMITQQVSEILRIEIEDGDLYPGTKIPTDTELAEMFGVQKQIVRTAIEVLVKEGLLKYISDYILLIIAKINYKNHIRIFFYKTFNAYSFFFYRHTSA